MNTREPERTSYHPVVMSSLAWLVISLGVVLFGGCKDETVNYSSDDLTNPAIQPRVMFTLPEDNSTGPFELYNKAENYAKPHFVIRFNKLMDLSSLDLSLIRVEGFDQPVRVFLFSGSYYFPPWEFKRSRVGRPSNSQYDNVLSFGIRDSLTYSTSTYDVGKFYSVVINPGLKDINGNVTSQPYRFTFRPEPEFRVVEIYPEDTTEAGISDPIRVVFNSPVNSSILPSVQLSPSLQGQWNIARYDTSVVEYRSFDFLPFKTSFSITVNSDAVDRSGNHIDHGSVSLFRVVPFKVFSTSPSDGGINARLDAGVWINFSGPLDGSTVPSSVTLSPSATGSFTYYSGSIVFQPTNGLNPSTSYTVSVASTIRAYEGTALQAPYTFSFSTAPFIVEASYPQDGSFNVSRSTTITIQCNALLDMPTALAAFSMSPPANGNFGLYDGNSSFSFSPTTALAANTIYTVTVATLLKSKTGYNLSQPFTFRFKTER